MESLTVDMADEARQEAYEERAAIQEYDGDLTREQAEVAAHAAWLGRRP
jgi:hypothetical protein